MKKVILILLCLASVLPAFSQVSAQMLVITSVYPEGNTGLLTLMNNETVQKQVTLKIEVKKDNHIFYSAQKANVILNAGQTQQVTLNGLNQVKINQASPAGKLYSNYKYLLSGSYSVCVSILDEATSEELDNVCEFFEQESTDFIQATAPEAEQTFDEGEPITFSWISSIPNSSNFKYKITINKRYNYQTLDQAIANASPILRADNIAGSNYTLPPGMITTDVPGEYVWRIEVSHKESYNAENNTEIKDDRNYFTSEVFTFKVNPKEEVIQSCYIKPTKEQLKFSYSISKEETIKLDLTLLKGKSDSLETISYNFTQLDNSGIVHTGELKVAKGNYFYELPRISGITPGTYYRLNLFLGKEQYSTKIIIK